MDELEKLLAHGELPMETGDNTCVCCGARIPEGRQVCPACEAKAGQDPSGISARELTDKNWQVAIDKAKELGEVSRDVQRVYKAVDLLGCAVGALINAFCHSIDINAILEAAEKIKKAAMEDPDIRAEIEETEGRK